MKALASLSLVTFALAMGAAALADNQDQAASDEPWFDMERCSCCKHLAANMDMVMNVAWENHKIERGGLMTAYVPQEYQDRWNKVMKEIETTGKLVGNGEELPLCNHCQSYYALVNDGAKVEEVKTGFGSVTLLTADKPELVNKIHAHIQRTQDEMDKIEAQMQQP